MKNLYGLLLLIANASIAVEIGQFEQHQAKTQGTTLGVIDLSDFSLKWLDKNKSYLIQNNIPVIVLNATENEVHQLIDQTGIVAGSVPPPVELIDELFKTLGLQLYPAVIEDNLIWQINPKHKGTRYE